MKESVGNVANRLRRILALAGDAISAFRQFDFRMFLMCDRSALFEIHKQFPGELRRLLVRGRNLALLPPISRIGNFQRVVMTGNFPVRENDLAGFLLSCG